MPDRERRLLPEHRVVRPAQRPDRWRVPDGARLHEAHRLRGRVLLRELRRLRGIQNVFATVSPGVLDLCSLSQRKRRNLRAFGVLRDRQRRHRRHVPAVGRLHEAFPVRPGRILHVLREVRGLPGAADVPAGQGRVDVRPVPDVAGRGLRAAGVLRDRQRRHGRAVPRGEGVRQARGLRVEGVLRELGEMRSRGRPGPLRREANGRRILRQGGAVRRGVQHRRKVPGPAAVRQPRRVRRGLRAPDDVLLALGGVQQGHAGAVRAQERAQGRRLLAPAALHPWPPLPDGQRVPRAKHVAQR
mmetsp:Transcript_81665/g.249459  ORF Transcript_81665/g.249459 Transcript_81665/m.249459 type:complete len:300 (+) Transcript_81665:426-1325(+)